MNVTPINKSSLGPTSSGPRTKIRINNLQEKKARHEPISALALGDFTSARLADEAGIDFVLVGDSLGSYLLGYENTLPVTLEEMLHHTRAVRRAVRYALVVADMPFGTYQVSLQEGVANEIVRVSKVISEEGRLTERPALVSFPRLIPREDWQFARMQNGQLVPDVNWVTMKGGFKPGMVYQVTYESKDPPVAGVGFAAVRDFASAVKY